MKIAAVTARHTRRAGPALRTLAETDPALAALSLWCLHRDGDRTATDGAAITYGPEVERLAPHEAVGLAAHHVLHVALRHPARMGDLHDRLGAAFHTELYALAADAVVNETLQLAGYALPRPAVTVTGLVRETLHRETTPEAALGEWSVDRLYFALTRDAGTAESARDHGMARHFAPDLVPTDGGADEAEEAARWRRHLARAMEAGRAAGRGLGTLGHRIADVPEPRTPWEVVLRRLASRALLHAPQPHPSRPSRRWIARTAQAWRMGTPAPGFEPGLRAFGAAPRIAVALDASGSVDDARLARLWAEVTGIGARMRAEMHLLVFDDGVRLHRRVEPGHRAAAPVMPRGGGTAYGPVFDAAAQLVPSVLVVLTDLDADMPPAPRFPVLWAVPGAGNRTPPFGHLVDLDA